MNFRLLFASAASAALLAGAVQAASQTGTLGVSATIVNECSINSVGALSFGTTIGGTIDTNVDATGTISVTCNSGTVYDIGLNAGAGAGTGDVVSTRVMTKGADTLSYQLYSDTARGVTWGNTVGTNTVSETGTGAAIVHTIYGRIPATAGDTVSGEYSDEVTITVSY